MSSNKKHPDDGASAKSVQLKQPGSMRLNIFKLEPENVSLLKTSLERAGLNEISVESDEHWRRSFWLTSANQLHGISWLAWYQDLIDDTFLTANHAGIYLLEGERGCFAVSYGSAFHQIHPLAEPEFGLDMAKRIGIEGQIKQRALRRFGSKRRKEITSFAPNSGLFVESGEAVDLLKAQVAEAYRPDYGKTAEFGRSFRLTVTGTRDAIPGLCDEIIKTLERPESFQLPMIVKLDKVESDRYDELLLDAILEGDDAPQFSAEGHEIVGVDFIFAGAAEFRLKLTGQISEKCDELDADALRKFIVSRGLGRDDVFKIKVEVREEAGQVRNRSLKNCLDYVVPDENVTLDDGQWKRFNREYLDQLNTAVDKINILETEPDFKVIKQTEPEFNDSTAVKAAGYENADKDFTLIDIGAAAPLEAYDLIRDDIAYAVKFGTTQKLSYVCEQALAVVEVLRNNADQAGFKAPTTYCLWLGFERKKLPDRLSDLKSVILKQRIAAWARGCEEVNMVPVVKLSLRDKPKEK